MADENSKKFKPLDVAGTTGLKQQGGIINEEFMVRLRGKNAIKLYEEMIHNSPAIAAALNAITLLISQVDWRVEPADESDAAIAEAEDTEGALEDMSHSWGDFISETLSMIWAGYAPFEIVYKLRRGPTAKDSSMRSKFDDGKFGWRKIEIRSQDTVETWEFDEEDGGLDGFTQMDQSAVGGGSVFIPMEKALLFRLSNFKGNPEGKSLIRPAVVPYMFTKRIQEFEAIGIERNLAGMPVMEVPFELLTSDATSQAKAAKAAMEKFVTQVRMDERWGGLVPAETLPNGQPSGYKFKLMQSSGRKLVDTDVIIKRYRSEMLMLFMAQFLVMGTEKVGSFSLASNMTDLFGTAIGSILDKIAEVVNQFMIPRRQRLNGVSAEFDPVLVHGDIEGPQLAELASYISSLSGAGVLTSTPALERKLLEVADLPQPVENEGLEPGSEAGADAAAEAVDPGEALNGAQIASLLTVLGQVRLGELPPDSAKSVISASFPISMDVIDEMLKPIIANLKANGPAVPAE